jgi:hypothetical protein
MNDPIAPRDERRALLTAGWILVLIAFFALRLIRGEAIVNQDELIPLRLAEAMSARGTLDPNWNFADLGILKYDSYNFYLYNLLAFFVIKPAQWLGLPALGALRVANVVMQLATMWLARDALRRMGADMRSQLFACALIAVAPGLVQDAYMARPESLIYLLIALLIWTLTLDIALTTRMAFAGLVLGAGIAVKVTFASAGLLVLVPVAEHWRERSMHEWGVCAAAVGLCTALAFAIAAPYAVIHPGVYLNGLARLAEQYRNAHPPHSLASYSFASQVWWTARYFVELYGPLLPVALAGPVWLRGPARRWAIGLVACWLVLAFYFATQRVFFERNFAHGLVPLLLASTLALQGVKSSAGRYVLAAAMLLPMTYWSSQIAIAVRSSFGSQEYELRNHLRVTHRIGARLWGQDHTPASCDTIAIIEYNDAQTRDYVAELEQSGFRLIGHYRGRFGALVTSTLKSYLDPGFYYLRCPK